MVNLVWDGLDRVNHTGCLKRQRHLRVGSGGLLGGVCTLLWDLGLPTMV